MLNIRYSTIDYYFLYILTKLKVNFFKSFNIEEEMIKLKTIKEKSEKSKN